VAVVISLKLVYTPVDDNVTAPHKSQVTSQKPCAYFETLCLCHMSSARSTSDGRGIATGMSSQKNFISWSPNHPSVASVAGRRWRSAESARAAVPRRRDPIGCRGTALIGGDGDCPGGNPRARWRPTDMEAGAGWRGGTDGRKGIRTQSISVGHAETGEGGWGARDGLGAWARRLEARARGRGTRRSRLREQRRGDGRSGAQRRQRRNTG